MALHRYNLYGLGVHSQIPLWGDGRANCPADVHVRWDENAAAAQAPRPGEIRLSWPDVCEMSIREGCEIIVRTDGPTEINHLRHLVSGIGLGLALYQRNVFALHASAVAIDGHAVAFIGAKGAGKSTLAAALAARGHTLLTDDVVAIDLPEDAPAMVRPGPTNLNLWPDSALATGHATGDLARIWSRSPKLVGWVAPTPDCQPVPLHAIFALSRTEAEPRVGERLAPLDAFAHLAGHTHAFRWIEDGHRLPEHLAQCRRVLQCVPLYGAERGQSLDSLQQLAESVERLVASGTDAASRATNPTPSRLRALG